MLVKAPFRLPAVFFAPFGSRYARRFVALFWEPCGDEACYDDGISYACGLSDNRLYLAFIRRPEVRSWLDENGIHLGSSDETAQHWLVVDAGTAEVFATPRHEARATLLRQRLSG